MSTNVFGKRAEGFASVGTSEDIVSYCLVYYDGFCRVKWLRNFLWALFLMSLATSHASENLSCLLWIVSLLSVEYNIPFLGV